MKFSKKRLLSFILFLRVRCFRAGIRKQKNETMYSSQTTPRHKSNVKIVPSFPRLSLPSKKLSRQKNSSILATHFLRLSQRLWPAEPQPLRKPGDSRACFPAAAPEAVLPLNDFSCSRANVIGSSYYSHSFSGEEKRSRTRRPKV